MPRRASAGPVRSARRRATGGVALPALPWGRPAWMAGATALSLGNSAPVRALADTTAYVLTGNTGTITQAAEVSGGTNVAIIGAHIDMPHLYRGATETISAYDKRRRALYLNQPCRGGGELYVEGLHIESSLSGLLEAIQMDGRYVSQYTFQNCRFTDLRNYNGERYADSTVAVGTTAVAIYVTGKQWAETVAGGLGYHDVTNSGASSLFVGRTSSVTQGTAEWTIPAGATLRIDIPANVELWAIRGAGAATENAVINTGGNHPDAIQNFGTTVSGDPAVKTFRMSHFYIATNYQGWFDQSGDILATDFRNGIIDGTSVMKDGDNSHGTLLTFRAETASKSFTNVVIRSRDDRRNLEVGGFANLEAAGLGPGITRISAAASLPFSPAPASLWQPGGAYA